MSWTARFISPQDDSRAAPLFRREIELPTDHGEVASASLRLSAHGVCEASINGRPVSDELLTPGWTSYEWRTRFTEHDVTELVQGAAIAIGIRVGNGWYRGRLGWEGGRAFYGSRLAAIAELRIRFSDGHEHLVVTDSQWRTSTGETTDDDLYDGQRIDARRAQPGWDSAGFDDSGWEPAEEIASDTARLVASAVPPVRRLREVAPVSVGLGPSGRVIVDFGENLVGWVRVTATGAAGARITIRHAEVLEEGEPAMRPLRSARATDEYTLSGGLDVFEPTFTFHGFRYVEVEGWPGDDYTRLTAVVVGSDLHRIGRFACSDPDLTRLHENVVRSMQGNFLALPTDCPQRDERLGWTGDIAVFAPTAAFLFDAQAFLADWLRDLALEQRAHGGVVPYVVPDLFRHTGVPAALEPFDATAIWGDAAAWVPWALWQAYGDPEMLREAYPSMAAHARRVRSLLSADGVWHTGFQFGDWLDPTAPPDDPMAAAADPGVVATASAYRTARILADTAAVLGYPDDLVEFEALAASLRAAFRSVYVGSGTIRSDSVTVYALAIVFGLVAEEDLRWAGDRLSELVAAAGHRISTGFAGTPFVLDALTRTGHTDAAYTLLLQPECPSWLYSVRMGATTIWERWDSMLPDGTVNPGEMTSFNHYALGAVADWMHRSIGGLAPAEPGYRRILVEPRLDGRLGWAKASLETPLGRASVRWELEGEQSDRVRLAVVVPPGSSALVRLGGIERELPAGSHDLTLPRPVGR
ncbi:family 78 glycoside hydrolase catalytic domain [Herbiconiux sp. KACC 21604]|uniref:alpha-L-rhamnosidase n=1 Tax=unclassified Herbiconiux TaxID=2618217 RepID=UPI001492E2B0|nr:alpha-L-rhamnosidase [Herbiconiux sp. SALV-R1]QJU52582.1 family 78 glycoside hydrolase catalytic domain [Herbiconiux sp. SALV-R1]WPO87467.1 family 78 glycoside hydrolase catalytic domain [Herbiconiux sp. KACC 21604]